MAAIAAVAECRLADGAQARAFIEKVREASLEKANSASAIGDIKTEVECLRAAFLTSQPTPTHLIEISAKLTERLNEELKHDPLDLGIVSALISIGGIKPDMLRDFFEKTLGENTHTLTGLMATAIVSAANGKLDNRLLRSLRVRTRELLAEKNAEAAIEYFLPLYRMAPTLESVSVLLPRLTRLISDHIKSKINKTPNADIEKLSTALAELDPTHPTTLRLQAVDAARNRQNDIVMQKLSQLKYISPKDLSLVLSAARAVLKIGDINTALALFDGLRENGTAEAEAAKVRKLALRSRLVKLRDSSRADDAVVYQAASDVLEIEPDNPRALWLQSRALMRQRKADESLKVLRKLLDVSPAYPGAAEFMQRLEKRGASV